MMQNLYKSIPKSKEKSSKLKLDSNVTYVIFENLKLDFHVVEEFMECNFDSMNS